MGSSEPLFFEDFRGAVRHLVGALGGPKKVGALLRPALTPERASNWVNDCLNPERDSKFDFEELSTLLRAGRELGVHCATWQLSDETGYTRPTIAPGKTREQELAEEMARALSQFKRLADEAAALRDPSGLRAVK